MEDESEYKTGNKLEIGKLVTAGAIFRDKENYKDAISCFDKALEIDQNDPLALSNKGGALIEMKKYEEALPLLEKAIEINPKFAEIAKKDNTFLYIKELPGFSAIVD